jgi:2-polyprenyl-3-methyl-5-hydroxy-6-metoxy-1,4-benzoquinol methylase
MFVDTRHRSGAPEIMDDFQMEGEILRDALDKIASINRLLGGNKVTLEGVEKLLKWSGQNGAFYKNGVMGNGTIRVLDVGCGNGDMLRTLADWGKRKGYRLQLIGMDANAFTVKHAARLSADYQEISYRCADVFEELETETVYDIVLCTLTLHHFSDANILRLLSAFGRQTRMGIVINDLHRSALAYHLFRGLCAVFGLNDMSREDGLVSILRGFKKKELERYAMQLGLKNEITGSGSKHTTIKWKWAFRYQWIIQTTGLQFKRIK